VNTKDIYFRRPHREQKDWRSAIGGPLSAAGLPAEQHAGLDRPSGSASGPKDS
jgi:hypothetical protein